MCGIAGVVSFSGPADPAVADGMGYRLRHRGPDGEGQYVSPGSRAAFAFRRLAIVDLATGGQPVSSEDGSIVSMFNGEIYNHRELRQELIGLGHRFTTDHADSEVIPHGYEAWGPRVLDRLRGMFAIALWDARRERLMLARDRLGEKPLYYRLEGLRLRFASEIAPLEEPNDSVDREALALYLTYQFIPAPNTIIRGIGKLEAGELAFFEAGGLSRQRYWSVPSGSHGTIGGNDVRTLLEEAVALRCQADVPIGAFLSGGVDSSLVTALLSRASRERIHTFSIGFPDPRLDETDAAKRVAEHLGTEHHVLRMDEVDATSVERAVASLGEPLADAAAIPTYLLSQHASKWVKVILTGEGADELFGGYARYRNQYRLRRLLGAPLPVRRVAAFGLREVVARIDRRFPARLPDLLDTPQSIQPREWRAVMPRTLRTALVPGVPSRVNDPVLRTAAVMGTDSIAGSFATDLATWVPEDLLVKVDRTTMAFGLEPRPPFLDHVLVEAVLSLPADRRWAPGRDKALLRDIAAQIIPPETATRPKQTFTTPTDSWLRGPLRASNVEATRALLDWGVDDVALAHLQRRSLHGGRDGGQWAWVMYVLGRWLLAHAGALERQLDA